MNPAPLARFAVSAALGLASLLPAAAQATAAGQAAPARPAAAAVPAPSLDRSVFADAGTGGEAILRVAAAARYSLAATAAAPAALSLVDRMSGVIASGQGRLDTFLEPGEYKVRITRKAGDRVQLEARAFRPAPGSPAFADTPLLKDGASFSGSLGDLETRSWWLRVDPSSRRFIAEISGRSLAGAVLWRDGTWETGIVPLSRSLDMASGRPLGHLEFNVDLESGLYLLTCFGGPRRAWGDDSRDEPLELRSGAAYLGSAGRLSVQLDARGMASFLASGTARTFQLQAAAASSCSVAVAPYEAGRSRLDSVARAAADPKSTSHRVSLSAGAGGKRQWVVLRGKAGEKLELRWLSELHSSAEPLLSVRPFPRSGTYYVAGLGSFEGEEGLDATALLVEESSSGGRRRVALRASSAALLGADAPLRRRANALESSSFLLEVAQRGSYAVWEKGTEVAARYQFIPAEELLAGAPAKSVELRAGGTIELQEKIYLVTVLPVRQGILDFAIGKSGDLFGAQRALAAAPAPAANAFSWAAAYVAKTSGTESRIVLGSRPGSALGIVAREYPLDLSEPIPLRLAGTEPLDLAITCPAPVRLRSLGASFSATLDDKPWNPDQVVPAGRHRLLVAAPAGAAGAPAWTVLGALPAGSPEQAAAPPAVLQDPSSLYPAFSAGRSAWRDFARGESAFYSLVVKESASYRVQTEGRLKMALEVRSLLRPGLFSAEANGPGGNAQVSAWLRPGSYLVRATALGQSRGRAGVTLSPVAVVEAGSLSGEGILRARVPPGSLLSARLELAAAAEWEISCMGLGRAFAWRLEDSGGWPLGPGLRQGDFRGELPAGAWRYLSFPDESATSRLLRLSPAPRAASASLGEMPRSARIALNETVKRVWVEAPGRPEDILSFDAPATLASTLSLSAGMGFRLLGPGGAELARGTGGRPLPLALPRGSCELRVASLEPDNLRSYSLLLAVDELAEGLETGIDAPGESVPVAVGRAGTIEIWSYGPEELEAGLYDESGSSLVAAGEPIDDDWNFRVVASVSPGRYLLRTWPAGASAQAAAPQAAPQAAGPEVAEGDFEGELAPEELSLPDAPVAAERGRIRLQLIARDETILPPATGSFQVRVELGSEVASLAFTAAQTGLYRFEADSAPGASLAVYREGIRVAAGRSPLFLPLAAGSSCSVRAWRPGNGRAPLLFRGSRMAETAIAAGPAPVAAAVAGPAARVTPWRGASVLVSGAADLLWSPGPGQAFAPLSEGPLAPAAGEIWLVRAGGGALGALSVASLALVPGSLRSMELGPDPQAFTAELAPATIGLLRADGSACGIGLAAWPLASGVASGAASGAAAAGAGRPDWSQGLRGRADRGDALIGLRPGSWRGIAWKAEGGRAARRSSLTLDSYPLGQDRVLLPADAAGFTVPPRSAVNLSWKGGAASLRLSLERGAAAFGWASGPAGSLDATRGALTGSLAPSVSSATLVNTLDRSILCAASLEALPEAMTILPGPGFEALLPGPAARSFRVELPADTLLWLAGGMDEPVLLRDSGIASRPERIESSFGPLWAFAGGPGRLELTSRGGLLKVWGSPRAALAASYTAREAGAREQPLPLPAAAGRASGRADSWAAALAPGAQSWSFSLEADRVVRVAAEGEGVLALYDRSGSLVAAAAGGAGQRIVQALGRGAYTVYVRPWKGGLRSGGLALRILAPSLVAGDGRGESVLAAPGEARLYRFTVTQKGRVGLGVTAQGEDIEASLYDASFALMGSGRLFVRELAAGDYWLLVESGSATQRYSTLFYGLGGSLGAVPDEIIERYTKE